VPWPRRITVPDGKPVTARTAVLPFTKVPGIIRFAYAGLVTLGVAAGLAVQAALLARANLAWAGALVYSLYAVAAGVAGAKAWFIAVHRGRMFDGWCIQGFVAGAARAASSAPRWNSAPVQAQTGSVSASCTHPAQPADPKP